MTPNRTMLLVGPNGHDGLWVSYRGCPLSPGRIYDIVRARTMKRFGKAMSLHDFRRAGATFIAMDAPDKVGLIPGGQIFEMRRRTCQVSGRSEVES